MKNLLNINNGRLVFFIFFLALLVRLAYVIPLDKTYFSGDGHAWNRLANDILHQKGYDSHWRGPIYPVFLAAIYFIAGPNNILIVRVIQSVLGAFTCVFIYYISKKIFNPLVGILSAILLIFYPYSIYYSGDILAETLFAFLISCSVLCIISVSEIPKLNLLLLTGFVFGLTILAKGVFLPFALLAGLWLIISTKNNKLEKIKKCIIIYVFMFLTLVPWIYHNYCKYGKFILTGLTGYNLWLANNPYAYKLESLPEMDQDRLPDDFVWYSVEKRKEINSLADIKADKRFKKEVIDWIKSNPLDFLNLALRRLRHYWRLYPIVATKKNKIIALCTSGIFLPLGWIGIVLSLKKYWRKTSLLILLLGSFTIIHMVFIATIRYRVPIDPLILVFTGYTFSIILKKLGIKINLKDDSRTTSL